jgi:hypothetical protein
MALFDRASIPGFCTVGRSNLGVVERGGVEKRSLSILPPLVDGKPISRRSAAYYWGLKPQTATFAF